MASDYRATDKHFTLVSGTATKLILPSGSKEHLIQVTPDVQWEFSFSEAQLTAGDAIRMKAGAVYTIDSSVAKTEVFIKQTSGSDKSLRWAYLYPSFR